MERALRIYLLLFGWLNLLVVSFTVPLLFGDRLLWQPRNLPVEMMLSVVYFAMGVVMLAAARRPLASKVFVDFLVLANTLHAAVMVLYAEHGLHLVIDAGVVGAMGVLPLAFYPWGLRSFLRYP